MPITGRCVVNNAFRNMPAIVERSYGGGSVFNFMKKAHECVRSPHTLAVCLYLGENGVDQ